MQNLNFLCLSELCSYEKRCQNMQYDSHSYTKALFSLKSYRNLQNLCAINLPSLWRAS